MQSTFPAPLMRATRLSEPRLIEIVDIPRPDLATGDVLIEVAAAGICGSDLHAWRGHHPFRRPPVIMGHEVSGTIVAVGDGVDAARLGERVVIEPQRICGTCAHCLAGRNQLCAERVLPGMNGWMGTLAEYFSAPASMAHVIPDSLDLELAALVEPLAVATHALRRANATRATRINIIGAGPIGALVTAVARAWGAEVDLVTDIDPDKLAFAADLGARHPLDVRTTDPVGFATANDALADVTVVAATAPASIVEAARMTRVGGTVLLLGLYGDTALIDAARTVTAEQSIVASVTYDSADYLSAIEMLAGSPELFARFITKTIGFDDLASEFESQSENRMFTMKTLVLPRVSASPVEH